MGVFLTLEPPTRGMVAQAAAAGFYKPEGDVNVNISYPKIQIINIAQLFQPASPLKMPWQDTSVFKKSQREPTPQPKLDL